MGVVENEKGCGGLIRLLGAVDEVVGCVDSDRRCRVGFELGLWC